ncbi:MAG: HEPN domain-containing protein [Candidatus Korarchaeota archaeon]|nr:HEPN domain-containing protein [Candidatus Korarchaeota archaeon]MDK2384685.1 HEPN domain-containing protein [Candidatus Korarchaeota archaeon]
MFDWEEYRRWIAQAEHTLRSIEADIRNGSFDWACFKAQQAAELALKALLRGAGREAFGHDLRKLHEEFKEICGSDFEGEVLHLSKFYIPARYPDAFPGGSPYEFFSLRDAETALDMARRVLEGVKRCASRIEEIAGEEER